MKSEINDYIHRIVKVSFTVHNEIIKAFPEIAKLKSGQYYIELQPQHYILANRMIIQSQDGSKLEFIRDCRNMFAKIAKHRLTNGSTFLIIE